MVGLGDLTVGLRWQISQPGSVGLSLNTKLIVWYIMGQTSMQRHGQYTKGDVSQQC